MNLLIRTSLLGLLVCCGSAASARPDSDAAGNAKGVRVVHASSLQWDALNPARGEASPRAATLWGSRTGSEATGFIASFQPGFSSPPHAHNVSYRGVVIEGAIHNDDPTAATMWMGPGSFWTQPRGEVHITAANDARNLALVEIDHGPYLVVPPAEGFDSGERPVNVDASNIVWLPLAEAAGAGHGAEVAHLWGAAGDGAWRGLFLRLPPSASGVLRTHGASSHAVVIRGVVSYGAAQPQRLLPGSYLGTDGPTPLPLASDATGPALLYLRTNGAVEWMATP